MLQKLIFFSSLLFLASCSGSENQKVAQYQHNQCHRLTLFDEDKELEVLGAEDIVRLKGGNLIVSAYDRRSKTKQGIPPEGGLYVLDYKDLSKKRLNVRSLIKKHKGGLRPHGLDALNIDKENHVAFVNRAYQDKKLKVQLVHFTLDEQNNIKEQKQSPLHCRANDIAIYKTDDALSYYVTRDRNSCSGLSAVAENVFGLHKGAILQVKDEKTTIYADEIFFPNGIGFQHPDRPINEKNFLAISETRGKNLRYFYGKDLQQEIPLLEGADNISVGRPGLIVAATHKSLLKLALYRYQWLGFSTAPSHIVKVTGNQKLTLFHDPTGKTFSAASVGVQTGKYLVLGSVGDKGLLVCSS